MLLRYLLLILSIFCSEQIIGQVALTNGSFEDKPNDATMPQGWDKCDQATTPDILPGFWGVEMEAEDGNTYLGLITRPDGSWETIGQKLDGQLEAKECYRFSMSLAHSKKYAKYNMPIQIKIWAGKTLCGRDQLLVETGLIKHSFWKTYEFQFFTDEAYDYIIIEAQPAPGVYFPYKGNILMDGISVFVKCNRA